MVPTQTNKLDCRDAFPSLYAVGNEYSLVHLQVVDKYFMHKPFCSSAISSFWNTVHESLSKEG